MHAFHLSGIDHSEFESLFALTDEQLAQIGAVRQVATHTPGFPCRISLVDAEPGEEVLLLPFVHQPAKSPYKASGPIFVRRNATSRRLDAREVPAYVSTRLMSVRAYDSNHMIVDAAVCEGADVASEIDRMFDSERVSYIHLHNAKRGCFSCRVDRN